MIETGRYSGFDFRTYPQTGSPVSYSFRDETDVPEAIDTYTFLARFREKTDTPEVRDFFWYHNQRLCNDYDQKIFYK